LVVADAICVSVIFEKLSGADTGAVKDGGRSAGRLGMTLGCGARSGSWSFE
jgi:hypothetical protein